MISYIEMSSTRNLVFNGCAIYTDSLFNCAVQIIFDNILNGKMPWPDVPGEMSYEAQDLINRYVLRILNPALVFL